MSTPAEFATSLDGDVFTPVSPLVVLSHRPPPEVHERQTFVSTGIEGAVTAAREAAGDKDVALMGGCVDVVPAPGVTHLHYEVVAR